MTSKIKKYSDFGGGQNEFTLDPSGDLFSQAIPLNGFPNLENSYRRLQLIYGLGSAIFEELELSQVLKTVTTALIRLLELERCFIATFDESGKIQPIVKHNINLQENTETWPISKTLMNRVLNEGVSILSYNVLDDSKYANIPSIGDYSIKSIMCVPLGLKDKCIGLIYADNLEKSGSFNQADLMFFTALSHYIYLGLRNVIEIEKEKAGRKLSDERWAALQNELFQEHHIIGKSPLLFDAFSRVKRVSDKKLPILLYGETGTGKELFAKAAHKLSKRSEKVFLPLNIAALSESLVESELFGHEKNAFSGATSKKIGRFELANGGTLFLDEVAEIPPHIQTKLLRVLETGEFERVGGTEQILTDVRLVCATNKNLEEAVKKNKFRKDLYFRLKGVTILIPALRDRSEDIPDIVVHFLTKLDSTKHFSNSALDVMQQYAWPGNVRQLARLVEEMDAVCESDEVKAEHLPIYLLSPNISSKSTSEFLPLKDVVLETECNYIRKTLKLTGGNSEKAIKLLGISRAKFFKRKKRMGI